MEIFCFIVKALVGDVLLPGITIAFGLATISRSCGAWFKRLERKVKTAKVLRWIIGLGLISGAVLFVFCDVRLQVSQARQQARLEKQQSPVYQQQVALNYEVEALARDLYRIAANYDKDWEVQNNFRQHELNWINTVLHELNRQGLSASNEVEIWDKASKAGHITGETITNMAGAFKALANQLPVSR
jgi:large-conductance mechanosensitive channel